MENQEFEQIESNLIKQFSYMPSDEQVRFFSATATLLLDNDQLRSLARILQERVIELED